MELPHLVLIFLVSAFSGSIGTLVGGGSLITIPTLIHLGLPAHTAIGTDKLGNLGIATAGWYQFNRKRLIDYPIGFTVGVPMMLGAGLGSNIVLAINESMLKIIIAIVTIFVLIFIAFFNPKMGIEKSTRVLRRYDYVAGIILAFSIGIYAGIYGGGAGTFLSYTLILVFRQTFLECAGTVKIAGVLYMPMSASIFGLNQAIHYPMALAMFLGTFSGSYVGAHYSDKIGNIWIKRLFLTVVLIMVIKLLI